MIKTSSCSKLNVDSSFRCSLRSKLILLFLAVSLIPLICCGWLAYSYAQKALKAEVINKLVAVRDIKAHRIAEYFEERLSDVKVFSQNPFTVNALRAFCDSVETGINGADKAEIINDLRAHYLGQSNLTNAGDGSAYSTVHAEYHPIFKAYKEIYDYYDIFLVETKTGNVIYSVTKEEDFGTSLNSGPYAHTNIGHIFQETLVNDRDFSLLEDFSYYPPSEDAASFVALPIFDETKQIGVLIFQLSTAQIDTIMQENTGLGKTGETLLVSSDDFLLRSNSRFFDEKTLFKLKMDNQATRAAANGETGVTEIVDYRGKDSLIAYTPVNIADVKWSLNAKIDTAEAFAAAQQMLMVMLIILGIGTVMVIGVAIFFSKTLTKPIRAMTEIVGQLAEGNLNPTITVSSRDEIGVMANAARQMIINLRQVIKDIVHISEGLAEGELCITPNIKYKGDFLPIRIALEKALLNRRLVVEDIVQVSQGLAQGDWNIKPAAEEYRGDFIRVKNALESAATKLAKSTGKNLQQDWLKTGQNQLNDQLRGEQNVQHLAEQIIRFMTSYLEATCGIFYLVENSSEKNQHNHLKMVATHAYNWRKTLKNEFQLGEGVVGQAALEQKMIVITEPSTEYPCLNSALSNTSTILAMPFLYEDQLKGVIELISEQELTEIQIEFLNQTMPTIAIVLHFAQARENEI